MARKPRMKSTQGIYHVILRGINKQQIFYNEEDYRYFAYLLNRYKEECGYEILAYCFMGNHFHLLIREGFQPLSLIFKHVGCAFVYWYNLKYERSGHLFQDRFTSEPVNDGAYLLTVFRYILNNPVKAGLCDGAVNYPYSSAREYLLGRTGITDQAFMRSILGDQDIARFLSLENNDICLDLNETEYVKCADGKAKRVILSEFGSFSRINCNDLDRASLNSSIRKVIHSGVSIRQFSRLTGISKSIVESALKP